MLEKFEGGGEDGRTALEAAAIFLQGITLAAVKAFEMLRLTGGSCTNFALQPALLLTARAR